MAQAARLSLRLQKELKLLLADPPPGASFPSLSSSSSSSLSSIDALIEGPEGSVYGNGVFKLKIEIPDRYPFQPPIVTFATPIYHPNIDNGGRICLDILNLPPKGAWQPSLNISTVLSSIGLLLSEPNPDDGLMHEASKEYKYNRQAFDQKARSLTEKFARPMASENANGDEVNQTLLSASSIPLEAKDVDGPKFEVNKGFANNRGICGANRKLSLELSGLNHKRNRSNEVDERSVNHFACNQMDTVGFEQISKEHETDYGKLQQNSKEKSIDIHQNDNRLQETEQKSSSFKLLGPLGERNNEDILVPKDCSSIPESERISRGSNKMFIASEQSSILSCSSISSQTGLSTQVSSHMETQTLNSPDYRNSDSFVLRRQKKLGLAGRRPHLGFAGSLQSHLQDNKENLILDLPSNHSVMLSMPSAIPQASEKENTCTTNLFNKRIRGITSKQPLKPLMELQGNDDNAKREKQFESQAISKSNPFEKLYHMEDHDDKVEQQEGSPLSENIVVLDSEDSEDETEVSRRCKISLARRRLMQKQKARV